MFSEGASAGCSVCSNQPPSRQLSLTPAQHINLGYSHFPQKIPPNRQKWGPQNEFPGITRTKGFCGNSTETLTFPEFPGPSRFRILGSPFSAFWGEMKLICWAALNYPPSLHMRSCLATFFQIFGGFGDRSCRGCFFIDVL